MNRPLLIFVSSAVLTAFLWIALWPEHRIPLKVIAPPGSAAPAWARERLTADLEALQTAKTAEAKYAAASRLAEIPIAEIPAALDGIKLINGRNLTLAAKTLLVRWASKDGEAAANWAWQRLQPQRMWEDAFKQIGPGWAWQDPAGLVEWTRRSFRKTEPGEVSAGQVIASDAPVLDFSQMSAIAGWLAPLKPLLAYETLKIRGGFSSEDLKLPKLLQTVSQVQEALLAFDSVEDLNPERMSGGEMLSSSLLGRWQELDPADFARSPHAAKLGIMNMAGVPAATDLWKAAAPDERAATAERLTHGFPEPQRSYIITGISKAWIAADPAGALRWLDRLSGPDRPTATSLYPELFPQMPAESFARISALPPAEARDAMVKAFDAWHLQRPDEAPEMQGWSEKQKRLWQDLQSLAAD